MTAQSLPLLWYSSSAPVTHSVKHEVFKPDHSPGTAEDEVSTHGDVLRDAWTIQCLLPLLCLETGPLDQSQVLWLSYPYDLGKLLPPPGVRGSLAEKHLGTTLRSQEQGVCHHLAQGKDGSYYPRKNWPL